MTGIQPATKKGSKNLLTHTHNTLTYTDSNTAICNEEHACNPLCVIVEVLNNAICNEEHACNPLCVTAEVLNNAVTDECLRMYKSLGFLRLPRYPMLVDGTMIDFMADSGAARSTIRPCDLPCEPGMTDLVFESTSASGHIISENYTVPLKCETEGGRALKHAFLCSETCPVPLMARDPMCKLNLKLTAGPFGIVIEEEQQMSCAKFEPQWAYEWQIKDSDWAQMILKLAKDRTVSANTESMLPDRLHCTSHVVLEREPQYEEEWFNGAENEKIRFNKIFWNENVCALSACLSEKQMQLFLITGKSAPHLSLTKATEQTWAALGLFVRKCMRATDWAEKGNGVKHSENVGAFMANCDFEVAVQRIMTAVVETAMEKHEHGSISATDVHPVLAEIPSKLWAKHKYDVGLIKGCEPVVITPKSDYRPCQSQYPLKKEALRGIRPVFESLLKEKVIIPCHDSPVRTPIFPVKKITSNTSEPVTWRFVQDLQAVNSAVIARAARVPNPYTILSQIPQNAMYFTVVDLANAFFSIPVEEKSQFWFAFDFDNKGYTFTRLCQGYCESPTIYNEALRRSLEPLILSSGTALLQYVDDLLICARDEVTCVADTVTLLNHLAREGHKVSLTKLQFVKQEITFLGHTITPNSKAISEKRIKAIKDVPRPITKKQLLSFLGMCAYCRTFIPNYSFLEKPLRALTTGKGLRSCDKIYWPTEAQEAFANMKLQLAQAPTLGLPVIERPFTQMVDEKHGFMSSVHLQTHGDRLRPVAYFSTKLDAVAAGLPHCLRAVAAAELAVLASREFVGYSDLTLMVPHAVSMILQEQRTSHLSTARWLRYHTILLDMPNVTVKRCTTLNPATLLSTEEDGEEHHCCLSVLEQVCTPRPDLLDTPLENCDNVLFVDGSASKDPQTGLNKVGFAVTTEFEVVKSGKLPSNYSAQGAELVALTEACKLMADKCVTIYTDSRYAFGVTRFWRTLEAQKCFEVGRTSDIKRIACV